MNNLSPGTSLSDYQSDHLFLLVGMNPLPNWVAARLLVRQGGTVWLLYSHTADAKNDPHSTEPLAQTLKKLLCQKHPDLKEVKLKSIDSSDNTAIEVRLKELLDDYTVPKDVGLNYTGATKPMSVHGYRVLERERPSAVFSYLDPRTLSLRVDGRQANPQAVFPILQNETLRKQVSLTLDELCGLHNYEKATDENKSIFAKLKGNPPLIKLAGMLTGMLAEDEEEGGTSFKDWQGWINRNLERHKALRLANALRNQFGKKDLSFPEFQEWAGENWSRYAEYEGGFLDGGLTSVTEALNTLCGRQATPKLIADKLLLNGATENQDFFKCKHWFESGWFEDYVALIFEEAAHAYGMTNVGTNLNYQPKNGSEANKFQLDAAALFGYQLFALSITASSKKQRVKEHLLEAFVRARQLGGDEARIGLVSYYHPPELLQAELARDWDGGDKIKVFGPRDLLDFSELQNKFTDWFKTANY